MGPVTCIDDDHNYGDDGDDDDDDAKAHRAIIVTLHELPCDPLTISERSRSFLSITIIRRAYEILHWRVIILAQVEVVRVDSSNWAAPVAGHLDMLSGEGGSITFGPFERGS